MLITGKRFICKQLFYRICHQCQGSTEIMGYIGKKHQFRMSCLFQLMRQLNQLVPLLRKSITLFLQLRLLSGKFRIQSVFSSESFIDYQQKSGYQ